MRITQPIGILLLGWPTFWALCLTNRQSIDLKIILLFSLGVVVMRSCGCIINDIADRNFDGHVDRTRFRPLVSGQVSLKEAAILFFILSAIALMLALQLNRFALELSCIGFLLAVLYPLTKRFTYWPQLILGLAFSWPIPMVFAAQLNTIPEDAWLLYSGAVLWTVAYDSTYALMDYSDDRRLPIKSTALLFASKTPYLIGVTQLGCLVLLMCVGLSLKLNNLYGFSLGIAALLMLYQQYLIGKAPPQYLKAFKNNHWVGMMIGLGFFLSGF